MKYIWVIYFTNLPSVMTATTEEVAYEIMEAHIKNITELNLPVPGDPSKTVRDVYLEELASDYERVLAGDADDFGILDVCHAELAPLYDSFKS